MTTFLTIVSGALVFIIGQIAIRFFLDPINEQRKIIREIKSLMVFHGDLISNPASEPNEERIQLREILRRQAGNLMASSSGIPWYNFWQNIGFVPKHDKISSASRALIGLANSLWGTSDMEGIKLWKQEVFIFLK